MAPASTSARVRGAKVGEYAKPYGVGDLDAVLGGGEETPGLVGADIEVRFRRDAGVGQAACRIHRPDTGGIEPTLQQDQHAVFLGHGKNRDDRSLERQRYLAELALCIALHAAHAAIHDFQVQAVARAGDVLDHEGALRHDHGGGCEVGRRRGRLDQPPARGAPVDEQV